MMFTKGIKLQITIKYHPVHSRFLTATGPNAMSALHVGSERLALGQISLQKLGLPEDWSVLLRIGNQSITICVIIRAFMITALGAERASNVAQVVLSLWSAEKINKNVILIGRVLDSVMFQGTIAEHV